MDSTGKALELTAGTGLGDYTADSTKALLGTTLAEKNNLKVGSTFTINSKTFTVAGLFDAGTAFGNNALYVTLPTAQTLAELPGELSTMIVTVNSMENVDAAKTALQSALGTDKADVTQGQRNLETAVSSLDSVKNISLVAFIAALGTAGLIILLIMVMLVRERRREIGVLKAIGAPQPHHRPAVRARGPGPGGPGQRGGRRHRLLRQRRHRLRADQLQHRHDGGPRRPARPAGFAGGGAADSRRRARAAPSAAPPSC